MTLTTGNSTDTCGVSHYRRVIQPSWSPPQQDNTLTVPRSGSRVGIPIPGSNDDSKTEHFVDAKSTDGAPPAFGKKFGRFSPDKEDDLNELKYLHISDDSGNEISCALGSKRNIQHQRRIKPRPSAKQADRCRPVSRLDSSDTEEVCEREYESDSSLDLEIDTDGSLSYSHKEKMKEWKALARGKFEEMLLECIVNTDKIPPNYENIFLDKEIIEKVEHVTMLGLKRPLAFSHGVLKNNRVTGAILYGPPGTGKTLLAKGVAKQSGFNMLSISTSEVWQKCHGDDEKMIKAIFCMARKMHPSIIFLDEADAMLGERKAGEKRHLRAMLNKFLSEWDGITSGNDAPFVLLATNRPNDLDPAVLRRAPMRIQLDLPKKHERLGILGLLLKGESLDEDITLSTLANLTPKYTGSDLKNLCVTAATECISEQPTDTAERTLRRRHFVAAMKSIKATTIGKTREQDLENFHSNRQEQAEE